MYSDIVSELRRQLPALLPPYLATQRWFGGKARQILSVAIDDALPIGSAGSPAVLLMVTVQYLEGAQETYAIPLVVLTPEQIGALGDSVLRLQLAGGSSGVYADAFTRQEFLGELLQIIRREGSVEGEKGRLRGSQTAEFAELFAVSQGEQPRLLSGEQSNSSVIYGRGLILKFFRRLEEGENPDLEIGRFLTEKARFPHVPRIAGSLEYDSQPGEAATQAILQEFVPNQGDAWRYTLKTLSAFYERAGDKVPSQEAAGSEIFPEFSGEAMARLLTEIGLLGKRTAEMHLALSSENGDAEFAPDPFTMEFQSSVQASFAELTSGVLRLLRARMANLPAAYRDKAAEVAACEQDIMKRFRDALRVPINAMRTRIHGDYHLGQVLYTGSDFVMIDFEGEPARPLAQRRAKQSPLQDVAGMLRSFHYAAFAPILGSGGATLRGRTEKLRYWAEAWSRCAANRFLGQYYEASGTARYLPAGERERARLLEIYLLGKAVYELGYELNNRPAWVGIPLEGIARLLSSSH